MPGVTVLVLGGGVGGLVCANELRRRLRREDCVVLIDREQNYLFTPSLLWLAVGTRKPQDITRDLSVLQRKGIEVVRGEVERIDPKERRVVAGGRELSGDYLVVSLGAHLAPETVPGLQEAGYNLYTLEGATAIRDARMGLSAGRVAVLIARMPFKCPAAPYEEAMLLEYDARKRRVRDALQFDIYTPEAGPMGVAGPEVSAGVRGLVESRGIGFHPQHQVERVDGAQKRIVFGDGAHADYDFLVYIPPHVAPPVVRDAGLTGQSGWATVDRNTMQTSFDRVYAIGDVAGIPLSVGLPLPKAGVFAHGEAEVVARNIADEMAGRKPGGQFDGNGDCFVETGDGKAAFGRGNFYGEPRPAVKLYNPGRHWHAGKVLFEKDWLRRWF